MEIRRREITGREIKIISIKRMDIRIKEIK